MNNTALPQTAVCKHVRSGGKSRPGTGAELTGIKVVIIDFLADGKKSLTKMAVKPWGNDFSSQ
jgi:hypothetical protein